MTSDEQFIRANRPPHCVTRMFALSLELAVTIANICDCFRGEYSFWRANSIAERAVREQKLVESIRHLYLP